MKTMVYCLSDGTTTAIHLDIDSLCDAIKMEYDGIHEDDLLSQKFTISTKEMTDQELDDLPEFDGF